MDGYLRIIDKNKTRAIALTGSFKTGIYQIKKEIEVGFPAFRLLLMPKSNIIN